MHHPPVEEAGDIQGCAERLDGVTLGTCKLHIQLGERR